MAHAWLVLEMTDSEFMVGAVNAVPALALLIFSPVGGAMADRYQKLKIARLSRLWVAIFTFITTYLVASNAVEIWHLLILGFLVGFAFALGNAATITLVFDLVGRPKMLSATSLNTMVTNIGTVIGPALGGILVAQVGISGAFWLLAFVYGVGFVALIGVPNNSSKPAQKKNSSAAKDALDGLKYAFGTPGVNWLMVLMMCIIFWGAMQPLIPVYARDILNKGADGYGFLFGANAAGSLISATAIFLIGDIKRKPLWLLLATYLFVATTVTFAYSTSYELSLLLFFIGGLGGGVWITFMFTLLQTAVAEEMRGRVMGVAISAIQLLGVGYLVGGALSEMTPPRFALITAMLAWAAVTTIAFARSRELREMEG